MGWSLEYQLERTLVENDDMRRDRLARTLDAMGLQRDTRTASFVLEHYRPAWCELTADEYDDAYSQESILEWLMGTIGGATE